MCVKSEGSRLAARHWYEGRVRGWHEREKVPPLFGAMHSTQGRTQDFNVAGNTFVVTQRNSFQHSLNLLCYIKKKKNFLHYAYDLADI